MADTQKTILTTKNNLNNESIFLYKLAEIFDNSKNYKLNFTKACELIKQYFQYSEDAEVIIKYKSVEYPKKDFSFSKTKWNLKQSFYTFNKQKVSLEVYYLKEHKTINEGSFTESEKEFIIKVSKILVGYLNILEAKHEISENKKIIEQLIEDKEYKLNELATLNRVQEIIKAGKSKANTLQEVCFELHKGMRHNEFVVAKIIFDGKVYASPKEFGNSELKPSKWNFYDISDIESKKLKIEVYYLKKIPKGKTNFFLDEEKDLIKRISSILKKYLGYVKKNEDEKNQQKQQLKTTSSLKNKIEYNFINKNNRVRDIFHDLMPFKVKEILLFANLYDAYSMEKEGRYSESILGEYYQLNLTTVPRITAVSSFDETFENLYSKHFDMVIIMTGQNKQIPIELSTYIKKEFNYIPVFLLLNNNADISYYQEPKNELKHIDDVFVWNGDSKIFFTIVKLLEDRVNIENDTKIGFARVILLVEDSAKYYSRYLPLLYTSVLNQTKRIIDDVSKLDELYKILRLRTRPKIMLASNYEQAIDIFDKYKDKMLCLITDVKFRKGGELKNDAGFKLVKHVRNEINDLPIVVQSSNIENKEQADKLKTSFIDKNTEALLQEIRKFISVNLGFGNFIFKDIDDNIYEEAKNLEEFVEKLKIIPEKSFLYHAGKNHFSLWLTARGEIEIAKKLAPVQIVDFNSTEEIRAYLLEVINNALYERTKGKVIEFSENSVWTEGTIASLSSGALGGKGRGIAFINSLLYSYDFSENIKGINLRTPRTAIIETDEFESFIEKNNLSEQIYDNTEHIKEVFIKANLSKELILKLKILLKQTKKPLAIRSSGLFEDSLMQPFAGVFETYILPNSHKDIKIRLKQVCKAIKLVYASTYSQTSRDYIKAINYKVEEEKMAVVIQELVGNKFDNVYYPHISGVAQSFNYYPFGHMKPEDGYAVAAIGLGTYVVTGEKAHRFCPKYPTLNNNTAKDQFKNSQLQFYAVDLSKTKINLLEGENAGLVRLDIDEAEKQGNLNHCASVFDSYNNTLISGIEKVGARVVDFSNILKYKYIPLAKTLEIILEIIKEALGTPVEIEFAIDLNKDKNRLTSFYLLQIKPLIGNANDYVIEEKEIDRSSLLLYTKSGMGNGLIDNLIDVIYVDKDSFDKSKTKEIATEIEQINKKMIEGNRKYILIGPGRWGTRDPWIGIPVNWTQISNAKIIVETSLEDFPLDASAGSHFFHNVISMNVGYFSVQHHTKECMINWNILNKQKLIYKTKYLKHIRFEKKLTVKMDGKKRISLISFDL